MSSTLKKSPIEEAPEPYRQESRTTTTKDSQQFLSRFTVYAFKKSTSASRKNTAVSAAVAVCASDVMSKAVVWGTRVFDVIRQLFCFGLIAFIGKERSNMAAIWETQIQSSSIQSTLNWNIRVLKCPYVLHPVSQKIPQCCLWNNSSLGLAIDGLSRPLI